MDFVDHNINKLYRYQHTLMNPEKSTAKDRKEAYLGMISVAKRTEEQKRLASYTIYKFFNDFPELAGAAIDALIILCQDIYKIIREESIVYLSSLCKNEEHIPKISDALAKLLMVDDQSKLQKVNESLQLILIHNAKTALTGVFNLVILRLSGREVSVSNVETFIIKELLKVLQNASADGLQNFMSSLESAMLGTTPKGQNGLVNTAVEQAEVNTEDEPVISEDENVERYIFCANQALPYFWYRIKSTPFIMYACEKLFPLHIWKLIGANNTDRDQQCLRLLQVFAKMTDYCGELDAPNLNLEAILNILEEYVPLPPSTQKDAAVEENPPFKFSHVECLLYALQNLGKQDNKYFEFKEDSNKLEKFRSRLQYLKQGTQRYIIPLRRAVYGKVPEKDEDKATSNEREIKKIALEPASNIITLIDDLLHSPPIFCLAVELSWITEKSNNANKRPVTFRSDADNGAKRKKAVDSNEPATSISALANNVKHINIVDSLAPTTSQSAVDTVDSHDTTHFLFANTRDQAILDNVLSELNAPQRSFRRMLENQTVLLDQNTNLRNQHTILEQNHFNLRAQHITVQNQYTELKEDRTNLMRNHIDLQGDHTNLMRNHTDLQSDLVTLQNQNDNLKLENDELKSKNGQLQRENDLLKYQNEALRVQNQGENR